MFGAIIPCGDCYNWALHYVMDNMEGTLVHGTIPASKVMGWPRAYAHAWVELDGRVLDWQTVEREMYAAQPKLAEEGWPIRKFYEMFQPIRMKRYSPEEAWRAYKHSKGGPPPFGRHSGPWHGRGSRGPR